MNLRYLKKIKYERIYNRKNQLNDQGQALIQIRAYQNGQTRFFTTGIYIEPKFWDKKKSLVKHNHPLEYQFNKQILGQEQAMKAFENRNILQYGSFPLAMLHQYETADKAVKTFTAFCEQELERPGIRPGTKRSQKHSLKVLHDYKLEIFFQDLDLHFITLFDRFMHKKGLGINTIHKHHRTVRTYINLAIQLGFIGKDKNPYQDFKLKQEEPERVFLTPDELFQFEKIAIPKRKRHLEKFKQMFLLSCYTGLRFGDLTRLSKKHIEQTAKGVQINMRLEKSRKNLSLPLWLLFKKEGSNWSKPEEIIMNVLSKKEAFYKRRELLGFPFFKATNQQYNRCLKELAEMANIDKKITTHVGRRTFGTIMATKVKTPILQRLFKHAKIDTTMIYVRLSNNMVEDELNKIDWS